MRNLQANVETCMRKIERQKIVEEKQKTMKSNLKNQEQNREMTKSYP